MTRIAEPGWPKHRHAGRSSTARALPAVLALTALALAATAFSSPAHAEVPACLSPDPSVWPGASKPYFMIAFDTSGVMKDSVGSDNSCGYQVGGSMQARREHGRCAIRNTLDAFSGQANFGLASFAELMTNCGSTCYSGCTFANYPNNTGGIGCGPGSCGTPVCRASANILVPMLQDNSFFSPAVPPPANNTPALLSWVDGSCAGSNELWANGSTPLNGILRDMFRYYSNHWTHPSGAPTYFSPLGTAAQGERPCRSVNVILVTAGGESCDTTADAVDAAATLLAGFTKGGIFWKVKTFVVGFGQVGGEADQIAAAGGTVAAYPANDEPGLSAALAAIIGSAVSPETCNNTDDNCNGCTDEGYTHHCNVQQTCCSLARATCLANYKASINANNPEGNLALLPCTSAASQSDPASWLCFNPKDACDAVDNNCNGQVDEGVSKCGSPEHCPFAETCNSQDDDCDGQIDEGLFGCSCVASPEICDGCDNDCDGIADDGVAPLPCGLVSPPNCTGTMSCKPPQAVPIGTCTGSSGFNACTNNPLPETCDNIDNDCDGVPDDNIAPTACESLQAPGGLIYNAQSQCKMGSKSCGGLCQGWVGPSVEVCDGVDNDCDGVVDDNVFGVNQACGINQPPCTPGSTACVGGALACQGGAGPQPEVCDGFDNDCDGVADEVPLADAPAPGLNGCWNDAGNACTFANLAWSPPTGATCAGIGTLNPQACKTGTLVCAAAAGWLCQGPTAPSPEVCDGVDNDCVLGIDNGAMPGVGTSCGSDVGTCVAGTLACKLGVLDCDGDTPAEAETCDGFDNDCDGDTDNGIPSGAACPVPYDTALYPGLRDKFPCQPGAFECNGLGIEPCVGGIGPAPEVCDGLDNDCDGVVDELGPAPDGINGSANPLAPPVGAIGDACGVDKGQCQQGTYACVNGLFACLGGQGPALEECDCVDNDCDGVTDDDAVDAPVCSPGKTCVKSPNGCQCAAPCGTGEIKCPPVQKCEEVTSSETSAPIGPYCIADPCGDCGADTKKDANDKVLCAPTGTAPENCVTPPPCVCKNLNGCQEPCFGVTCAAGLVCTNWGPDAGSCVVDNCYNIPCQGCDKACYLGACVSNPCVAGSCPASLVCKPSADFTSFACVPSCAAVECPAGQTCVGGACAPTCDPACSAVETCDMSQAPPACAGNKCLDTTCPSGACCNPLTGACGPCPCEGVICPDAQSCIQGDCFFTMGSGPGPSSGPASSSSSGTPATGSGGGDGAGGSVRGVWGLATGGGGCALSVPSTSGSRSGAVWALLVAAVAVARGRSKRGRAEEVVR